jgi:hypothetical protein
MQHVLNRQLTLKGQYKKCTTDVGHKTHTWHWLSMTGTPPSRRISFCTTGRLYEAWDSTACAADLFDQHTWSYPGTKSSTLCRQRS